MKRLPLVASLLACSLTVAQAVPESIRLADGRTLEKVTDAKMEGGKVRVTHAGGVSRVEIARISPESLNDLSIAVPAGAFMPATPRPVALPTVNLLWTKDAGFFHHAREFKVIDPISVSFTHDGGEQTARMESLEKEIQAQLGYDKAKADEYEAALAAEKVAKREASAREDRQRMAAEAKEAAKAAKLAAREESMRQAYLNEVRNEMYYNLEMGRRYGFDVADAMRRQDRNMQREQDLRNAANARFYSGKR